MMSSSTKDPLVRVADRKSEAVFSHPLNPRSQMFWVPLSDAVGMQRAGVHLIRLPPDKESAIYHSHTAEEEWIFILSGRGISEIGDQEHEVGPGDFMGFATPSVGHHLRNESDEDLVYLVGGERRDLEIAEFPRLGKVVLRVGQRADVVDKSQIRRFWPPEKVPGVEEV
jgi:uncharacterized cupin superfamily protein